MDVLSAIFEKHLSVLHYTDVRNKKLLICFAGVPGSGKTYLARLIEDKYNGIRLSNDEVREIIVDILGKDDEENRERLLHEYLGYFISHFKSPNGLIILDSGIERKYDRVKEMANKYKFKIFVINVDASLDRVRDRIALRPKHDREHFEREIGRWTKEYRDFISKVKVDFTFGSEGDVDLNWLFERLDGVVR